MGKGHRDNHAARVKRGSKAFGLKAERRAVDPNRAKCRCCGTESRTKVLKDGICPICESRLTHTTI